MLAFKKINIQMTERSKIYTVHYGNNPDLASNPVLTQRTQLSNQIRPNYPQQETKNYGNTPRTLPKWGIILSTYDGSHPSVRKMTIIATH
jgi:hypothetical protein